MLFFLLLFIVLIIVILEQGYLAVTVNIYLIILETRWIIYIFRFVGTQIKEENTDRYISHKAGRDRTYQGDHGTD